MDRQPNGPNRNDGENQQASVVGGLCRQIVAAEIRTNPRPQKTSIMLTSVDGELMTQIKVRAERASKSANSMAVLWQLAWERAAPGTMLNY